MLLKSGPLKPVTATLAGAVAGALLGAAVAAAPAAAATHLDIVTFGGTSNLPIWVAMDRGLFAKEGLEVKQDVTKGSVAEIKNMMAGKYQIGTTSFDNSIAYAEGQADIKIPDYDIVGIMGVHSGMNSVVTRPEIKTYADIKGKVAASDALNSGYGVMLFAILDKHGLKLNRDYTAIAVGSGPKRLEAMKENKAVVAALSAPEDTEAKKDGYNILDDAVSALGMPYQGSAYVVRRSWAKAHEPEVLKFIRAIVAAHEYVYANKAGSIEVLKAHVKKLSPEDLEVVYAALTNPKGGLNRGAKMNIDGVKTLLKLRGEYSEPKKNLTDPYKYVDLSYYEKATKK
jgi:ABC-type nitrate/sulfonate/bicarbonate transport system substrate-binding protein